MVGRSVTPEPSFDDSRSYIAAVKEAFQDEPAKYEEFKKLLNDYRARRVDSASLIASVEELMRDHWKLLPGFSVFHPKAKTTISPEAKRTIPPKAKRTIPLEAKATIPPEAKTTILLDVNRTIPPELNTTILLDVNRTIPPEPKTTIPPEPNRTILTDANKGLGQFHTMVERRSSSELTIDDSRSYIAAVKEAFNDEPEKYQEFLQILKYVNTHREDEALCYARVKELMKDHRNLLLGFNVFLPAESKITIPPEVNRTIPLKPIKAIPLKAIRAIPLESKTTIPPEANITIHPEAKRIIHPEAKATTPPEAKITIIFKAKRTTYPVAKTTIPPEANRTIPPEAERTIPTEGKTTMALEANATTPPEEKIIIIPKAKRTIPPEAEHHGAEFNCTKRKRVEPESVDFMEKLKTRFRTLDTHVVESFCKIMKKFRKGKKSEKEVHREVVDLLYYHEDLIEDFSRFLTQKYYIY